MVRGHLPNRRGRNGWFGRGRGGSGRGGGVGGRDADRVVRIEVNPGPGAALQQGNRKIFCCKCGAENSRSQECCGTCGLRLWDREICRQCLMTEPPGVVWAYCPRCGLARNPVLPAPAQPPAQVAAVVPQQQPMDQQ